MGKQVGARAYGGIAQLGERLPCKQEVTSSILVISIRIRKEGRRNGAGRRREGDRKEWSGPERKRRDERNGAEKKAVYLENCT